MKILMDFDGVFTDPTREGARCREIFRERLADLAGMAPADVRRETDLAEALLRENRFDYGWRFNGRLSAFGIEDPFILGLGTADVFDRLADQGHPPMATARDRLRARGVASYGALGQLAFQGMSEELQAAGGAEPDPEAVACVKAWLAEGQGVRVVSNSDPSKLRLFFEKCGIPEGARFGFLGGARKFELGDEPASLELGPMKIDVDRPRYREVLLSEKPDAVVGDCLSLDLALPLALARAGALASRLRLVLKRRHYTPTATLEACRGDARLRPCDTWAEVRAAIAGSP